MRVSPGLLICRELAACSGKTMRLDRDRLGAFRPAPARVVLGVPDTIGCFSVYRKPVCSALRAGAVLWGELSGKVTRMAANGRTQTR